MTNVRYRELRHDWVRNSGYYRSVNVRPVIQDSLRGSGGRVSRRLRKRPDVAGRHGLAGLPRKRGAGLAGRGPHAWAPLRGLMRPGTRRNSPFDAISTPTL